MLPPMIRGPYTTAIYVVCLRCPGQVGINAMEEVPYDLPLPPCDRCYGEVRPWLYSLTLIPGE